MPVTVADLRRSARRVHDVGEQHRGENTVVRHLCLVPGDELGDLLERIAPRFHVVKHVAPWQFNVFRARDVIGDVLAISRRDERVVGVLDDQSRHANGRQHRLHVHRGY